MDSILLKLRYFNEEMAITSIQLIDSSDLTNIQKLYLTDKMINYTQTHPRKTQHMKKAMRSFQ